MIVLFRKCAKFPGPRTTSVAFSVLVPNSAEWMDDIFSHPDVIQIIPGGATAPLVRGLNAPLMLNAPDNQGPWAAVYEDNPLKVGVWHVRVIQTPFSAVGNNENFWTLYARNHLITHPVDGPGFTPEFFSDLNTSTPPHTQVQEYDFSVLPSVDECSCNHFFIWEVVRLPMFSAFNTGQSWIVWSWRVDIDAHWVGDLPP